MVQCIVASSQPFVLHSFILYIEWQSSCLFRKKNTRWWGVHYLNSIFGSLCIWNAVNTFFFIMFINKLVSCRRWKLETSCRSQVKMYLSAARTDGSTQTGLLILLSPVSFLYHDKSVQNLIIQDMRRYSTFVNWELWWPQFPILVYFKETQTKPEGQWYSWVRQFTQLNKFVFRYHGIHNRCYGTEWPTVIRCNGGACWTLEDEWP